MGKVTKSYQQVGKTFRRIPVLYLSAVIFVIYITSCAIMVLLVR